MKLKIRLILLMFCLVMTGCAGTGKGGASFRNEPGSFRGIKWGQNIAVLKNMRLVSRDNKGLSIYSRSDDQLSFGEAKLRRVRYVFWQNKFMEGQMVAAPDQLQALKKALYELYGEVHNPYGPNAKVHDYSWDGPVANVHLLRPNFLADCEVKITSREINNRMNHDIKARAKTAP